MCVWGGGGGVETLLTVVSSKKNGCSEQFLMQCMFYDSICIERQC